MTTMNNTTAPVNVTFADLLGALARARAAEEAATEAWADADPDTAEETAAEAAMRLAEDSVAAAEAALEAYEGPRPWLLREEQGVALELEPCSLEEAISRAHKWAREGSYDVDRTIIVRTYIYDPVTEERVDVVVTSIEPSPPRCVAGGEHDWRETHVRGHGGGVVVTERCDRCAALRVTDTWATDPGDGSQGHTVVSYTDAEDDRYY